MEKMHVFGLLVFFVVLAAGAAFAQIGGVSSLQNTLGALCSGVSTIMPIAAVLGVFSSGTVYAIGQFSGAETRARATVWAMALLTGSVMGVMIQVVTPSLVGAMYGSTITCSGSVVPPSGGCGSGPACGAGYSCVSGACVASGPCPGQYYCSANGGCCVANHAACNSGACIAIGS